MAEFLERLLEVGCRRLLRDVALVIDELIKLVVFVHRPDRLRPDIEEVVDPLPEVKFLVEGRGIVLFTRREVVLFLRISLQFSRVTVVDDDHHDFGEIHTQYRREQEARFVLQIVVHLHDHEDGAGPGGHGDAGSSPRQELHPQVSRQYVDNIENHAGSMEVKRDCKTASTGVKFPPKAVLDEIKWQAKREGDYHSNHEDSLIFGAIDLLSDKLGRLVQYIT